MELTLNLNDYLEYTQINHEELQRYVRYQTYIKEGKDYIKFDEFE